RIVVHHRVDPQDRRRLRPRLVMTPVPKDRTTALPGREPAPTAAAPFPLDGLRVLDLSRVLSGPLVGRALADLGADVVKVEGPDGDLVQLYGEVRAGRSGFYAQQNSGKRAIAVDLAVPGAA